MKVLCTSYNIKVLPLFIRDTSHDIREGFEEKSFTIFVYGNIRELNVSSRVVIFQLRTFVLWNLFCIVRELVILKNVI